MVSFEQLEKIQLSVTDMCNRKCNICPHVDPKIFPNKKVWMTIDTAQKLAKDLLSNNYTGVVSISGYGEPLLHKQIFNIISEFTKRGIKTRLHTNADLIIKNKVNYKILDRLLLDEIVVSIYDGPEQYVKYKSFLLTRFKNTKLIFRDLYVKDVKEEIISLINLRNRAGTLFESNKQISSPCHRPLYNIQIDWDGSVLICCDDWKRKITYGNINDDSISNIWKNNSSLNEHRKLLLSGKRDNILTCSGCNSMVTKEEKLTDWNLHEVL
jgi:radical SAM protein with 4Fe4S-binding SPASM domain